MLFAEIAKSYKTACPFSIDNQDLLDFINNSTYQEDYKKPFRNHLITIDAEDYFFAKPLNFKQVHYVFQAIANLIPLKKTLKFDIKTKEQSKKYKGLNIGSWNKFVRINRMNLLMAVLLFTEEFIYYPVTMPNVIFTDTKLIVYGEYLTFKVSRHKDKTYVSIRIHYVMELQYIMLN